MSFTNDVPYKTKLIAGAYKYPVVITKKGNRLWFAFSYNKPLMAEVKVMAGAKWHGYDENPIKQWSVTDCPRNRFQIEVLEGKNPFGRYDKELIKYQGTGREYPHQLDLVAHGITRQYCIIAAEMSTGKTLSAIRIMEWLAANRGIKSWFYVAPKSALISVQEEFDHWHALIRPQFFTYEALKTIIANWPEGSPPPQGVIGDEASRLKNPTAQRTAAFQHLANAIREKWGDNGAVILMTGTPAPKGPTDWWSLTEICQPGFLREGDVGKFRNRLAIMADGKSEAGGVFQKLVSYKDDEKKCNTCGKYQKDYEHDITNPSKHFFMPCTNEVELLYERMKGLVVTCFKKDVQKHLPEKIFKIIRCQPTLELVNAAKLITARGDSSIRTMTLLRELSDGFQYQEQDVGSERCPLCEGTKTYRDNKYVGPEEDYDRIQELLHNGQDIPAGYFELVTLPCVHCDGMGEVTKYIREAVQIPCPKEDVLLDIIDEHDEIGRLVTYAGFTGSVDRCVSAFVKQGWSVVRVDGRGWHGIGLTGDAGSLYRQWKRDKEKRIAFVAQPGAGGMGLNLQESPTIVFYSNDFNGESRMQALERTHRPGMDISRGCKIIDLFNLPTDELVLANLDAKKKLQAITMGEIRSKLEVK